jgi:hypothetical protein
MAFLGRAAAELSSDWCQVNGKWGSANFEQRRFLGVTSCLSEAMLCGPGVLE